MTALVVSRYASGNLFGGSLMPLPTLEALVRNAPNRLLALDPGGTTGWSYWRGCTLAAAGQQHLDMSNLDEFLDAYPADQLIVEDYRVYDWAAKYHTFSSLQTVRLIGAIEHAAAQRHLPIHEELAVHAKQFSTDEKLAAWGVLQRGQVHANDSIRHACYWLIMRPKPDHAKYQHTHRVG